MKSKTYSAIEVEIAKNLVEKGHEWIARDSDDALYAYDTKPEKGRSVWMCTSGMPPRPLLYQPARGVIPLFDSVNWTDAEPISLRGIVRQDTETAGLHHCNIVPPDTVSDFCSITKITVETDEENPVQIAMISSDSIGLMDGYQLKLTPRDTERG